MQSTVKVEAVQNSLKNDISAVNDVKDIPPPSYLRIAACYFSSIGVIMATIYGYVYYIAPKLDAKTMDETALMGYKLGLALSIWFCTYLFVDSMVSFIAARIGELGPRERFLTTSLLYKREMIKIGVALFVTSISMNVYEEFLKKEYYVTVPIEELSLSSEGKLEPELGTKEPKKKLDTTVEAEEIKALHKFFIENFIFIMKVIMAASIFILIMLFKSFLVDAINYTMHVDNYEDRIKKSMSDYHLLRILNNATGAEMTGDVETWAAYVFKSLAGEKEEITAKELEFFLGRDDSVKMLLLFDVNNSGSITIDEFIAVYRSIINEKLQIQQSLAQSNSTIQRLDSILIIIFTALALFCSSLMFADPKKVNNTITVAFGAVMSLSFAFSSLVSEIFRSMIYIFLVRPFDVGDIIQVAGNFYEVIEVGLLYSTFKSKREFQTLKNSLFMDKPVINYRITKVTEKVHTYLFNMEEFVKNRENLQEEINKIILENPQIFDSKWVMTDFQCRRSDLIGVTFKFGYNIIGQNLSKAKERDDRFVIVLSNIFKSLKLKLYNN